jgi:putative ABC transport system substrate-binding protein
MNRRVFLSTVADGFAADGGLIAYGPDILAIYWQARGLIAKVLRGTRPDEIPIARPARLDLILNLRTAKALGLTIPPSLLQRADQVIE